MNLNLSRYFGSWMFLLVLATLTPANSVQAEESDLPANSVYHFTAALEDEHGQIIGLDHFRGQPTLVTMFYASCPHVCPLLISTIKVTEAKLTDVELQKLRVMTISVDPERDTPAVLLETKQRHAVDADRWTMVRPEPNALRPLAGIFGIKYKKLPDGEFNHSTRIVLLDQYGTPIAHTTQLGRHDPLFLEAIQAALK